MSRRALEDALREGGEKVTQGRIRIDSARALQRLRDFRFADPAHWVLEVLRAAVLSGAKAVTVRTDADDVEVDFDGEPFPAEAMGTLLEQALNPGTTEDERRTRLLALGVAGALGIGARFVSVRSGGVALRLTTASVEQAKEPGKSTSLHLRKALGWRVASALLRGSPEQAAILERCQRFPIPLTLNEKRVQPKASAAAGHDTRSAQGPGWRLEALVPWGDPLPRSVLELDVGGVLVARRELELPGLQVHAWLRGDGLRRNASGSDVVDDDPALKKALEALRALSLDLLTRRARALEPEEEAWRHHFVDRLLALAPRAKREGAVPITTFGGKGTRSRAEEQRVREGLAEAKLLPGPGGEWYSLAEIEEAAKTEGRLFFATERHPSGSSPKPTLYLPHGSGLKALLPTVKYLDVAELVQRRARITARRTEVEAREVEPAVLSGQWVAKAPITVPGMAGEVGLTRGGHGAFVRVLAQGRHLEAGDLASLAPLRLRAVVDVQGSLADTYFDPLFASKVLGLVADGVEAAATRAILATLPAPEVFPHARGLLAHLVLAKEESLAALPAALRAAPLFACLEGPPVSLDTLAPESTWPFTPRRTGFGRLDGSRVLVLDAEERSVLERLGKKRLEDVSRQLDQEVEVRRRLSGPKQPPRLEDDVVVETPVRGEGLQGLVGIPALGGSRLALELRRQGIRFEETELTARYHHASASVECEALQPNARWDGVVRDEAFSRVITAVAEAERRLAAELAKKPEAAQTPGGRLYVLAFLKKELTPFTAGALDEVTRAFATAPLFSTTAGPRSLLELADVAREGQPLLWLPPGERPKHVPDELVVLTEPELLVSVLAEALRSGKENAAPRLARLAALQRLAQQPSMPFQLPASCTLQAEASHEGARVLAGLLPGVEAWATMHVTVTGRLLVTERVPCSLPLEVLIEWPELLPAVDGALTSEQRATLAEALSEGSLAVLRKALQSPEEPEARRALLLAVGRRLDDRLPPAERTTLCALPLFECTEGPPRGVVELEADAPPLRVATKDLRGALPDRKPVVRALDQATRVAIRRWGAVEHADSALEAQNAALAARAAMPEVKEITSAAWSPWRRRLDTPVAQGEVLVNREQAGRLELYFERRPLVVLEGVLPGPLVAAVDAPRITPKPGFAGVVEDGALKAVIDTVTEAAVALAADVATAPAAEGPEVARVQLAFWVAGLESWRWRGQKKKSKGKAKGKKREPASEVKPHPLASLPLLRYSDRSPCSVADLVARGTVDFASREGAFLEPDRVAWWPREHEREWAEALGLRLVDVTKDVEFAATLKARPRLAPKVPRPGRWTGAVSGPNLVGEVQLSARADNRLVLEVLHQGVLVETLDEPRGIGGLARVEGSALTPDTTWTSVKRDAAFKALLAAVDAALASLLAARLAERDEAWQGWAVHAVQRFAEGSHPLASLVGQLALVKDLRGGPVTIGALLARAERDRRLKVAAAGVAAPDDGALVLQDELLTRTVLRSLAIEFDDVTGLLRRKHDLRESLSKRRLSSLAWKGEALARVTVTTPGFAGELALSADGTSGLALARDGIPAGQPLTTWPGVVGVLDVADLEVDEDWTTYSLTRAQRSAVRVEVERLYGALAERAAELDVEDRPLALAATLAWLGELGVESPGHLERLGGATRALVAAPLLETMQGERVSLLAVAAEIVTRHRVAVTTTRALSPVTEQLVLFVETLEEPWLEAFEERFGKTRLWRVKGQAEWRQAMQEADPLEGTQEAVGLRFLRRELRLLRSGALGKLTPEDLEDVKLHRAEGDVAVRYDRKRKLVLLDPGHPLIARTLKEAKQRPERLWVLLATLFGHVNRALQHVTDQHEAQLLLALAGHLAANPRLLSAPE